MPLTRLLRNWFKAATPAKDRFRTGYKPTQVTMDKLFDSFACMADPDDTATNTAQGLVRLATDTESINRDPATVDGLANAVRPYQIPTFVSAGATIDITEGSQSPAVGKTRKKINLEATIVVSEADYGNQPVTVTQSNPGENAAIGWNETKNPVSGKLKVSDPDQYKYLEDAITSSDDSIGLLTEITSPGPSQDCQIDFIVKKVGKPKEICMWFGTVAEMTAQFPAGYCNSGTSRWLGFAICDGGTYNSVVTPDMRGLFPVGYKAVDYPNIGTADYNKDGNGDQGVKDVTLTAAQSGLPAHNHAVTDPGHTHSYVNWPDQADIGDGGTSASNNDTGTNQTTGSNTTGITIDNNVAAAASDAHENRPPFATVLFVMYVGV